MPEPRLEEVDLAIDLPRDSDSESGTLSKSAFLCPDNVFSAEEKVS